MQPAVTVDTCCHCLFVKDTDRAIDRVSPLACRTCEWIFSMRLSQLPSELTSSHASRRGCFTTVGNYQ